MNTTIKSLILTAIILAGISSCKQDKANENGQNENAEAENISKDHHDDDKGLESKVLHLTPEKFKAMDLKVDSLPTKSLSGNVHANGELEVPPQNEAAITAIIGANITAIKVIEGDKVNKGQVLGYLSHPDLIKLQTDYSTAFNKLDYLEKEYQRQKRLYEGNVASGKTFQKAESEYRSTKGMVSGLEAQLRLLGVNLDRIRDGKIYNQVPIISPIEGYVENVNIRIGQFVPQQKELFEIVNTDHIHADLLVFSKDASKVKKGQKVEFTVESLPGTILKAEIYSVGKTFEKNPKAVHIHAEIENKTNNLFPGMYISGKIATSNHLVTALPEEAIVIENGNPYIFTAKQITQNGNQKWALSPLKIVTGVKDDGWVEIKLLDSLPKGKQVVWNKAYYLISEMKKGEMEHHH